VEGLFSEDRGTKAYGILKKALLLSGDERFQRKVKLKGDQRMTDDYGDHGASNDLDRTMPTRDETAANHSAEEAAVRALYQQLMNGWNQGSGDAFAAVFTEDGDLIGFDGTHFKGREEIAPFHQRLFDKWLKGSHLVGQVKDVRFLSPDVALMHAIGGTVLRGKSEPVPERDSIQTLVATRQEGDQWRLAAFQNTRLHPMDSSAGPFLIWTLSDLLWKVHRLIMQRTRRRQGG
jgi:uncharacterized protein (TIGR02246 family)